MTTEQDITEHFGEPIFTYTLDNAVEDGMMVDLREINPNYARGMFSHATINLMGMGYLDLEKNKVNLPNLQDLIIQASRIVRKKSHNSIEHEGHYAGEIELPSGKEYMIFIERNELGRYTLMLPADY